MIFSPFLPSFFTSNIIKRSVVPISDFFWVPKLHVEASPFTYIYISPLLEQMIHSQNSVTFIENIIIMYCIYNHIYNIYIYIYILCYHGNHLMWLGVSSKIQLLLNIPPAGVQLEVCGYNPWPCGPRVLSTNVLHSRWYTMYLVYTSPTMVYTCTYILHINIYI